MKTAPYTFPHKSRRAMIDYLTERKSHHGAFTWNVKVHGADFDGDALRKHNADLDPVFDAKWDQYLRRNDDLFNVFCEDASRQLTDGEWCSYPGTDQGDWQFGFAGSMGGWLVLQKWLDRDVTAMYSDADEAKDCIASYGRASAGHGAPDNLDCWNFQTLRAFYRGIRTADSDFTQAKATAEVEYQAAFHRECKEEEWRAAKDAKIAREVAAIEASRPDMGYAQVNC